METNQVQICVPVCEQSLDEFERKIVSAAGVGDIIELRLDYLEPAWLESGWIDPTKIEELRAKAQKLNRQTITTFRPSEQGGQRELDHNSRRIFWSQNSRTNDLVDIELDVCLSFSSSENSLPVNLNWQQIICSHHDFEGVPLELDQIYEQMARTPARILKIAVLANDVTDCLPMFRLLDRARREGREMIAIAMGNAGIATRVLSPSRGALLTYGALEPECATAPGQVTAKELRELYRIDEISQQTQIMGLVGLPVGHSVSPQIQNAAFAAAGVNGVYLPFEVRDVSRFINRMVHPGTRQIDWNLRGLSVTAPHKAAVIEHLDWIEPSAKEIGAVNTVVVDDGVLLGYNTDATAVLKPVTEKLGPLRDARCAVVGAGGAASAALWSLRNEGAQVTLFARNQEKGRALAEKYAFRCDRLDSPSLNGFDLVINATPLGTLGPLQAATPASVVQLRGARLAYDLVYNPIETRFLREAKEAGCEVLGGLAMLIAQAAEQFKLWTGKKAPESVMWEASQKALQ
jgi:3-dehydroquinate dehydratase/shikimate dehydrogenase